MRIQLLYYLPIAVCLSAVSGANAQSTVVDRPAVQAEEIDRESKAAAPGTYQFIVTEDGAKEAFLKDILVTAEQLRRPHETVYYRISKNVTMLVPSQEEICRKDFKPLTEYVIRKDND
ncbi:MAG: hypothetical protein RL021_911 [Bacteroidota bacterium]